MNDLILFVFLLLAFLVVAYMVFTHQTPEAKWRELQQMETIETIAHWSNLRCASWLPVNAKEQEIKSYSESEFDQIVVYNLERVGLIEEADYYKSRRKHKEAGSTFVTNDQSSGTPLASWSVNYKH